MEFKQRLPYALRHAAAHVALAVEFHLALGRVDVHVHAGRVDFHRGPEVLLSSVLQIVGGDRNAPIALICRTGNRTSQAQQFLQAQGFTRVYNVREGMAGSAAGPGWLKRELPVESCAQC